jgi:DNA primase
MKKKKATTDHKIHAAALDLLRDPKFLFNVGQQIGAAGVVGERQNRLVLYLACLTSALEKVVSVLVKGPTSTGKNNLTKGVLSLIPPEKVLTRSSFSEKALAYGAEELAGRIVYLVEHRGGKDAEFFRRLLQSEGELHHEATTVSGANRGTEVASRTGDPVFISTTTDERVYEDDETRFLSIRADESEKLTREVVRAQFQKKRKGKK